MSIKRSIHIKGYELLLDKKVMFYNGGFDTKIKRGNSFLLQAI